jgi:cytochrome P450
MYIVNSASLITAVQSQFRKLSFTAIEANIAADLIGVDKPTNDIIGHDVTNDSSYLMSFPKYVHSALSAGAGLDAMNRRAIQVLAESIDSWSAKGNSTIKLFEWVRHELLMASTEGVYGPKNPFRDVAMEKAWYRFEPGMMMFILKAFPKVTAKDAYNAREYMVKVWEEYFENSNFEQGSDLIKARVKINDDFGITRKQTARIEIGGSQAILTNTLPGAFWMVYHLFSDATVLNDIRAELSQGLRMDQGNYVIDLAFVKGSCPLLLSTLKEMMRLHSTGTASRIAQEDVILDGTYLLKKGSTILMPSLVQHTSPSIWGDSVDNFDHKRFTRGAKRTNPVAFRGFGGGTTLCPGRHFASTEILMFSALLVLRFDLVPVGGEWKQPTTVKSPLVNALPVPDFDFDVELKPRGNRDDKWTISFSGYDKDMEISAEDIKSTTLGG